MTGNGIDTRSMSVRELRRHTEAQMSPAGAKKANGNVLDLKEWMQTDPFEQLRKDRENELAAMEPEDRERLLARERREQHERTRQASDPRTDSASRPDKRATLITLRASDIIMKPIDWAWPSRIARGKPTLIAGEPGVGKSTVLLSTAATFSVGGKWPCGEGTAPRGSVIILSAEDDPADTIKPRFLAAGGDATRLHIIRAVQEGESKRGFNLQADLARLEAKIREIGDVVAVIIDPVSSYMGKTDSHKNSETRGVIDPLTEMASSTGAAFLLNTHFPKSSPNNKVRAIYRFVGSIAFVGAARTAFAVVRDPDDDARRLLLPVKTNIGAMPSGLAYTLEQGLAGYVESDGRQEPIYASRVVWADEPVTISADEAIAAGEAPTAGETQAPERNEAEEFLRSWLRDCSRPAKEMTRAAKDAGISEKTLRRARERICDTVSIKNGEGRITGHEWRLKSPVAGAIVNATCPPDAPDAHA